MSHKSAKKIRRKLRAERSENAPVSVERNVPKPLPQKLLMRRKDPLSLAKAQRSGGLEGQRVYQGGAILHPMSERAMYQFAKKRGLDG